MDWSEYQARVALHDQHLESLLATARAYADTYQELQARHCLRATAPSSLLRRRAADLQRQAETSCKRNIGLKARSAQLARQARARPAPVPTQRKEEQASSPEPLPQTVPTCFPARQTRNEQCGHGRSEPRHGAPRATHRDTHPSSHQLPTAPDGPHMTSHPTLSDTRRYPPLSHAAPDERRDDESDAVSQDASLTDQDLDGAPDTTPTSNRASLPRLESSSSPAAELDPVASDQQHTAASEATSQVPAHNAAAISTLNGVADLVPSSPTSELPPSDILLGGSDKADTGSVGNEERDQAQHASPRRATFADVLHPSDDEDADFSLSALSLSGNQLTLHPSIADSDFDF